MNVSLGWYASIGPDSLLENYAPRASRGERLTSLGALWHLAQGPVAGGVSSAVLKNTSAPEAHDGSHSGDRSGKSQESFLLVSGERSVSHDEDGALDPTGVPRCVAVASGGSGGD